MTTRTTSETIEGKKKRKKVDVQVDSGFSGPGTRTTFFDVAPPPEGMNIASNVKVLTEEEKLRQTQLTPQQKLEQVKNEQYQKGDYSMFSEQELTNKAKAEGKAVLEPNVPIQAQVLNKVTGKPMQITLTAGEANALPISAEEQNKRNIIDKIANMGASVPVAVANFISKGLKVAGVDIGTITADEFTRTPIGKILGLAAAGAELYGGYRALSAAASFIPSGGIKGLLGGMSVNSGIKMGTITKTLLGAGIISGAIYKLSNDSKNAMLGTLQTADLTAEAVKLGYISPSEAILLMNDYEQQINDTASKAHKWNMISPLNWISGGKDLEVDIRNTQLQLQIKRQSLMGISNQNI